MNGKAPAPCPVCGGARWVCEDDQTKQWTDEAAKQGKVGVPCPKCNQPAAALRARRRS
jgi:hypothetical protein